MLPEFKKTDEDELYDIEKNIIDLIRALGDLNPFLRGKSIDIELVSGSNDIYHSFNRTPHGWFLIDKDSVATIYRTAWDEDKISLTASAALNGKLWIW